MLRLGILFVFMLVGCLPLGAQVVKDSIFPANPVEGTYFLHTSRHVGYRFHAGEWRHMGNGHFTDLVRTGDLYAFRGVRKEAGGKVWPQYQAPWFIASISSGRVIAEADSVFGGDSILVYLQGSSVMILSNRPSLEPEARYLVTRFDTNCAGMDQDTIGGMIAYTAPSPSLAKAYGGHQCKAFRNWGILGTNGKWLIAPQYDEPFVFKNGVAEVKYYGEKRIIDEKGNFLK